MKQMQRAMTRMAFLHEAAFEIVLRDGCAALTRRALAAELGIPDSSVRHLIDSALPLATLAAAHCQSLRRRAWVTRDVTPSPVEQAARFLLPDGNEIAEALVWLRLVLDHATWEVAVGGDDLKARFQVADRGWSDPEPVADQAPDEAAQSSGPTVAMFIDDRRDHDRSIVESVIDHGHGDVELEVEVEVESILALVDGLLLASCTGRLSPTDARTQLVARLTERPRSAEAPAQASSCST